ncbi:MAG: hypothetical protein ACUVXB_17850, partial [Bryobacteraceae bacterium]
MDIFEPAEVREALLLPELRDYELGGKRYELALAEPVPVRPGETLLSEVARALSARGSSVRTVIAVAPGFIPGSLFP